MSGEDCALRRQPAVFQRRVHQSISESSDSRSIPERTSDSSSAICSSDGTYLLTVLFVLFGGLLCLMMRKLIEDAPRKADCVDMAQRPWLTNHRICLARWYLPVDNIGIQSEDQMEIDINSIGHWQATVQTNSSKAYNVNLRAQSKHKCRPRTMRPTSSLTSPSRDPLSQPFHLV